MTWERQSISEQLMLLKIKKVILILRITADQSAQDIILQVCRSEQIIRRLNNLHRLSLLSLPI